MRRCWRWTIHRSPVAHPPAHAVLRQLDIEMAFTPMENIIALGEELMAAAFKEGLGIDLPRPFPRLTFAEAMARYGSDKPDTRYGMELRDISTLARSGLCNRWAPASSLFVL